MHRPGFGPALAVLLLLGASGLYLIGNGRVGLFDRDEPRYAQTSRQMAESDPPDWIVPRYLDDVRTAKPILIYWCQAASMTLLGVGEFAARLPSSLAAVATLLLLGLAIAGRIGPRRALWTVLVLGTTLLFIAAAKLAITDALLLLFVTAAQLCLFSLYQGRGGWLATVGLWLSIGLAILTKGPVVLAVQLPTVIALVLLDRFRPARPPGGWRASIAWLARTRPLAGIPIALAVAAPWFIAVHFSAPEFLRTSVGHDVLTRAVRALEGHRGPPGYYLLTIWPAFFPWSLLLVTAIALAIRHLRLAPVRFAVAAVVGPWLLFEIIATKLPHYLLPTFPALAFLTADAIVRCIRRQHDDLHRRAAVAATAVWALFVLALAALPWTALRWFPDAPLPAMIAFSAVAIGYAMLVLVLFMRRRVAAACASIGMGIALCVAVMWWGYLPHAAFLWLPQRIAAALQAHGATGPGDVLMIDYKEDSLAFYQGGTIREADDDYLLATPPPRWPPWIVITQKMLDAQPADVREQLEIVDRFRGLRYASRMRIVEVVVVRRIDAKDLGL
jgi:4-amino-4-deoxy-L-arabinose transferase-like glycosyltransferase